MLKKGVTKISFILLVEQTAPQTPSANQVVLYPKSDGLIYQKDDAGTERVIAQGIATQAQQETGTDVTVSVTPGRQQFHPSSAKFVINAASGFASIIASYNVTSLTDSSVGRAVINLTTGFSNTNYTVINGLGDQVGVENAAYKIWYVRSSASAVGIVVQDCEANDSVDAEMSTAGFGDQ